MLRKSKYGYTWVTLGLFATAFAAHWWFGWSAYVHEAATHGESPEVRVWLVEMARDTFENWQSEFLQLVWQVAGLTWLLHTGSPASRDGDERLESKVDEILRRTQRIDIVNETRIK
jgi:hypothetical protein